MTIIERLFWRGLCVQCLLSIIDCHVEYAQKDRHRTMPEKKTMMMVHVGEHNLTSVPEKKENEVDDNDHDETSNSHVDIGSWTSLVHVILSSNSMDLATPFQ